MLELEFSPRVRYCQYPETERITNPLWWFWLDSLHIMRLGRWESIQMVERYTRSVRFEALDIEQDAGPP